MTSNDWAMKQDRGGGGGGGRVWFRYKLGWRKLNFMNALTNRIAYTPLASD